MKAIHLPLMVVALGLALGFTMCGGARQRSSIKPLNSELLKAAQRGDTAQVGALLDLGADQKDQALLLAAQQGKPKAVKLLLDRGAHIEARGINRDTALIAAAGHPQTDALKLLLDCGANAEATNNQGETALTEAARSGNTDSISLLLARGTFTTGDKEKALFAAAESEPTTIKIQVPPGGTTPGTKNPASPAPDWAGAVKVLLQGGGMGVDVRYEGATLLEHAAGFGQTDIVKMLLAMGADVDAADTSGDTPLLAAACNCAAIDMPDTLESMRLLSDARANIEARDKERDTPLMRAAGSGQPDNVKLLLDHGAKIDLRNDHGDTALTLAASARYGAQADTVKLLVERGANVNALNQDGNTPLILLASAPYYSRDSDTNGMVRLLLAEGADPRARNRKGQTALSAARQSGQARVVGLLQESLVKYP